MNLTLIAVFSCFFFIGCKKNKHTIEKIDFFSNKQYNYETIGDSLKMAYLDIGNRKDPIILLMHGEPNSSFLYRNIAPKLVKQHFRVIIPDLIGFGYSDKPTNSNIITYLNHTKWLTNFIKQLKLTDIHLFAHDWGGMISLRIVANQPELFQKVAVSYSYLFEGSETIPDSFMGFVNYAQNEPTFSAGNIMDWGSNIKLPDSIKLQYDTPFKSKSDFNAVRKFPSLIPTNKDEKEAIINQELNVKLKNFNKPFITIWGNHNDLMWKGKDSILQQNIPGAKNQTHYNLNANHFIQEDQPEELTQILIDFFSYNN
ncbi:haloalkane dehalogenase [Lutibacter agarilyticus]|uniref:Haloalkane dehalogenase n=1 Tax=Lutibacter agarilyticus TaxID=1109740 RepID=A0A238VE55_9FLAO|nr:haloalkane dehalogenase [Lutibacter agarilyticus]SNR31973.1 haloalkane dehalogenase [Lutibacter agarilyticus]